MSSRVNNYGNDLNYNSGKLADMDDDFEDYNEGENLDDDDFVEGDYTDVDAIKSRKSSYQEMRRLKGSFQVIYCSSSRS
jgi:hypothetical protein